MCDHRARKDRAQETPREKPACQRQASWCRQRDPGKESLWSLSLQEGVQQPCLCPEGLARSHTASGLSRRVRPSLPSCAPVRAQQPGHSAFMVSPQVAAINPNHPLAQMPLPPSMKNCIQLAACEANELLPMIPDLPADLFTSCLTTPIKIALRW